MELIQLNQILDVYKLKYPQIKDVYIQLIQQDYKLIYVGRCVMDLVGDFVVKGKNRYKKTIPRYIEIMDNEPNKIFILLHEIGHAITDYCERKKSNKNDWIVMDHNRDFYNNLLEIVDYAFEKKIIKKKFDFSTLKKFDNM